MRRNLHLCLALVVAAAVTLVVIWKWKSREATANSGIPAQNAPCLPQIESMRDSNLHWESRIQAVRELPEKLDDASVGQLFRLLRTPQSSDMESWYLVCNQILETLRQRELPDGVYTKELISLVKSPSAHPVIRDYAVQHLALWISGINPASRENDSARAVGAFDAMLKQAIRSENGQITLAGTTLNALTDAALNGTVATDTMRKDLGITALRILQTKDGSYTSFNRASALQCAVRLSVPDLLPLCRAMLSEPTELSDLRLGSIAALGQIGADEDIELLRSFESDPRYQFAANAALKRVSKREANH
jgi:hypothetical protein